MKNKLFVKLTLIITLSILIIPALIVFIVDPIQLYHDQISLKKEKFFQQQRHQNIGLINKFLKRSDEKYNNIIMGTSMSENFRPSKFEKALNNNEKVLKLTMSGGRPLEQYTLIEKALETGKVKKVFWDLHTYYLYSKISQKDKNHDFPYKLYSDNLFTQGLFYLFNRDYVKNSIDVYKGKVNWGEWTENLDKLNFWEDKDIKRKIFRKYHSEKNLKKLNDKILNREVSFDEFWQKNYNYSNIEKYVINVIKKYPDVEFNIYFPPYSTWFYRTVKYQDLGRFLYVRKFMAEKSSQLQNLKVFGFDNEYDIVNNIYNYKDYGHFRSYINDFIMENMINDRNQLNLANVESYLKNMIDNINNYDEIYFKEIKK